MKMKNFDDKQESSVITTSIQTELFKIATHKQMKKSKDKFKHETKLIRDD